MATANTIVVGRDNPVRIQVELVGNTNLTGFTRIDATFGSDTRTSDTDFVNVVGTDVLELKFGTTTERGSNYWKIVGYSSTFPNGFEFTSECLTGDELSPTSVCV